MNRTDQKKLNTAVTEGVVQAMSPWRSVRAACLYLGVSRSWLLKLRRDNRITAYLDDAGHVRFKVEDLDKLFTLETPSNITA